MKGETPTREASVTYLRDYFPGQPFRDYDPYRKTCTPSIEGGARSLTVSLAALWSLATLATTLFHAWAYWG